MQHKTWYRHSFWIIALFAAILIAACAPAAPAAQAPASGGEAASNVDKLCNDVEVAPKDGKYDLGGCTLRIAVENAYQPFNYIDTNTGKAVGYDYDIFAEICVRSNCKTEFIETSWDAMVAIMGGQGDPETFDVGADGITITTERGQHVDFSIPYIRSEQVLLVRKDESRFAEPEEFAANSELKLGTQIGTTNYDAAKELLGTEDRIVAFDQFGPAVQALMAGDVDAVTIDNVSGMGYVGANADKLKLTGKPLRVEELGFMFGKGSKLKAPVDTALEAMKTDGKLDEIYKKWFEKAE
jgi:polar amino acid transport system substrate-binding protein